MYNLFTYNLCTDKETQSVLHIENVVFFSCRVTKCNEYFSRNQLYVNGV